MIRWLLILLLTGCIEYRYARKGAPDYYYGWAHSKPHLDPKIGPKGKLYLIDEGATRPYISGNLRQGNVRANLGVIYYIDDNRSIELGYQRPLIDLQFLDRRRIRGLDPFKDAQELFYIGGVLKF